jgi:putative transposase
LVIRIGEQHPRSVTLPKLGSIRVHDDTRRLRRLLHPVEQIDPDTGLRKVAPLARILFITCSRHGSRWYISLNVRAPDFHPERRHQPGLDDDSSGFVGVDRGLAAFAVVATAQGTEVGRYQSPFPQPCESDPPAVPTTCQNQQGSPKLPA